MQTTGIELVTYEALGSPQSGGIYRVDGVGMVSIENSEIDLWSKIGFSGAAVVQMNSLLRGESSSGNVLRLVG